MQSGQGIRIGVVDIWWGAEMRWYIRILVMAPVYVIVSLTVREILKGNASNVASIASHGPTVAVCPNIAKAAVDLQRRLPTRADDDTEAVSAVANDCVLRVNYRLVRYTSKEVTQGMLDYTLPALKARVCKDPSVKPLFLSGGSLQYWYTDKHNLPIGMLQIVNCLDQQ